jgi:hypothetical protein
MTLSSAIRGTLVVQLTYPDPISTNEKEDDTSWQAWRLVRT